MGRGSPKRSLVARGIPWGNHIVKNASGTVITNEAFIGNINPIRYRSYYYDTETKLYYLNARYYDPDVCRFISPDDLSYLDPETIGGTNLYAYCGINFHMIQRRQGISPAFFFAKFCRPRVDYLSFLDFM